MAGENDFDLMEGAHIGDAPPADQNSSDGNNGGNPGAGGQGAAAPAAAANPGAAAPAAAPAAAAAPAKVEPPKVEPYSFANEESKRIHDLLREGKVDDVYSVLSERRTLAGVNDMAAPDVVKLSIKYENPDADAAELEEIYNDKYALPEKPEQAEWQDDEDYKKDLGKWDKEVKTIQKAIEKDAKAAKKALAGKVADIKLPETPAPTPQQPQFTPEQVAQWERDFTTAMDDANKNLNEYTATYSDEEGEVQAKYVITPEERKTILDRVPDLDLRQYFEGRYYKDGKPNLRQLAEDIHWLENRDKIVGTIVKDAVTQRIAKRIIDEKNIDFTGQNNGGGVQTKSVNAAILESFGNF